MGPEATGTGERDDTELGFCGETGGRGLGFSAPPVEILTAAESDCGVTVREREKPCIGTFRGIELLHGVPVVGFGESFNFRPRAVAIGPLFRGNGLERRIGEVRALVEEVRTVRPIVARLPQTLFVARADLNLVFGELHDSFSLRMPELAPRGAFPEEGAARGQRIQRAKRSRSRLVRLVRLASTHAISSPLLG